MKNEGRKKGRRENEEIIGVSKRVEIEREKERVFVV